MGAANFERKTSNKNGQFVTMVDLMPVNVAVAYPVDLETTYVTELSTKARRGIEATAKDVVAAVQGIAKSISQISAIATVIFAASEEQSSVPEDVVSNVAGVSEAPDETAVAASSCWRAISPGGRPLGQSSIFHRLGLV